MQNIPELISPDAEALKRINKGLGQVLTRLRDKGVIPGTVTGATLIADPPHLYVFLKVFKENRDAGEGILVDPAGNLVSDDHTPLVCGFSAAQLERFLVIACARKAYADFGGETKGNLPDELKPYLAFGWQLPLLNIFVQKMSRYQFAELGHGILFLKSPSRVKKLAGASATDIRKVRKLVGDRYDEMMRENPVAIRGISNCDERSFDCFVKIAGDRLWSFFGGDQQLVVELLGEEKKRLLSLGPHFPDLCVDTYRALEEIPTPMLAPFMRSFTKVLGSPGRALLGDQKFAMEFLVNMVNDFRELKAASNEELRAVE
ncbi:MAG: hypothetical protein H8E30_02755, partial [Alphaproteobacteria bacterium]|nr:hypothetical protein [Alphaproteobacteria bacterium]